MSRLELRLVVAAVLAAAVVVGAVVCAAYGWTIVASVLSIFALGVGAWLYHSVERWPSPAASARCVRRPGRCSRCCR